MIANYAEIRKWSSTFAEVMNLRNSVKDQHPQINLLREENIHIKDMGPKLGTPQNDF